MTTNKLDQERDLAADLALCEAATAGPWETMPDECGPEGMGVFEADGYGCICEVGDPYPRGNNRPTENMRLIAEAREGWPYAIRRAMAAEAEVKRIKRSYRLLLAVNDGNYARSCEYSGEIKRLQAFIESESEGALDTFVEIEKLRKERDYWRAEAKQANLLNAEMNGECVGYAEENEKLRNSLMTVYQKARNDCARWDGGQCVGTPVFRDRVFARRLVRDLEPILFPEVNDIANED